MATQINIPKQQSVLIPSDSSQFQPSKSTILIQRITSTPNSTPTSQNASPSYNNSTPKRRLIKIADTNKPVTALRNQSSGSFSIDGEMNSQVDVSDPSLCTQRAKRHLEFDIPSSQAKSSSLSAQDDQNAHVPFTNINIENTLNKVFKN